MRLKGWRCSRLINLRYNTQRVFQKSLLFQLRYFLQSVQCEILTNLPKRGILMVTWFLRTGKSRQKKSKMRNNNKCAVGKVENNIENNNAFFRSSLWLFDQKAAIFARKACLSRFCADLVSGNGLPSGHDYLRHC